MRGWDKIGRSIDRMAWPERIIWIVLTFGGTSVIEFNGFITEVSPTFKVLMIAVLWLIICAAGYYRLGWIARRRQSDAIGDRHGTSTANDLEAYPTLTEAGVRFYSGTGTELRATILAMGNSETFIMTYCKKAILQCVGNGLITAYGRRSGALPLELIDASAVQELQIHNGNDLIESHGKSPRFLDVRIDPSSIDLCLGIYQRSVEAPTRDDARELRRAAQLLHDTLITDVIGNSATAAEDALGRFMEIGSLFADHATLSEPISGMRQTARSMIRNLEARHTGLSFQPSDEIRTRLARDLTEAKDEILQKTRHAID